MGRIGDLLFSVLEFLLSPIRRYNQRKLDAWIEARAGQPAPVREPPKPTWDPADPGAPDWTLRMDTIALPPGPGTRARRVAVDLWADGRGRYAAGDARDAPDLISELPAPTTRTLLTMVGAAFPGGFDDFGAFQNGRMVLFDGTPATLTVFRRQPYAFIVVHTNLGFVGEFEGEVPAPPVLDVCELLSRLHQKDYRPG